MRPNVKRIAKQRSKKRKARPTTGSETATSVVVPEIVEPMPAVASPQPVAPSAAPATAPRVGGKVVLGASCTIHEAAALRSHLLAQAECAGPYEIDGSAVQQIDTAGLQLVVAFALDCLERGIHYLWTGRSPALDEAIRTLGVGALLESPGGATPYSAAGAA